MVGLFTRGPAWHHQRRIGADGLSEPAVYLAPLAGQQLIVHRLTDEGVPEHIAVGNGKQHIGRHGRPQRPGQRGAIQPGDCSQQAVTSPLATRARDPDYLLRLFGQPPHTAHQQVVQ